MPRPTMNGPQFRFPQPTSFVQWVLGVLFGLYIAELVARNALGLPIDTLFVWQGWGEGFLVWQPLTRYLVQGNSVLNVIIAAVVLFFILPTMDKLFSRQRLLQALAFSALGGSLLTFLMDITGMVSGATFGWGPLFTTLFVLFGLKLPDATIMLFFIIPIQARWIAWGTGLVTLLFLLSSFSMATADHFGTWCGAIAWWYLLGPGARRRKLMQKARNIEKQLGSFTVLDGGRSDNRDDDWVH